MKRKHQRYPQEFKAEAVRLAESSGKPKTEIAKQLGISDRTLHEWINQNKAETDEPVESQEYKQLRKEHEQLKREHEILLKAAAFFARKNV